MVVENNQIISSTSNWSRDPLINLAHSVEHPTSEPEIPGPITGWKSKSGTYLQMILISDFESIFINVFFYRITGNIHSKFKLSHLHANDERLSKTEDVFFAVLSDIYVWEDSFINLPGDCKMVCALQGEEIKRL